MVRPPGPLWYPPPSQPGAQFPLHVWSGYVATHRAASPWLTTCPAGAASIASGAPFCADVATPVLGDGRAYHPGVAPGDGAWFQALAVVRAERDDMEAFLTTLGEALRQVQPLSSREPVRWHELIRFILAWALYR
jgi:hypothetical protein